MATEEALPGGIAGLGGGAGTGGIAGAGGSPDGCVGPSAETPPTPAGAGIPADGLVLWVRADHGVYKNAQNEVCAWHDQSGKGNDLRQYTARPIWQNAAIGGQPAVHAATTSHLLYADGVLGIPATSGRTFIAVAQLITATGRFNPIIQGQGSTPGTYLMIGATGGDGLVVEALVYDHALTADESTAVETVLKTRYGL